MSPCSDELRGTFLIPPHTHTHQSASLHWAAYRKTHNASWFWGMKENRFCEFLLLSRHVRNVRFLNVVKLTLNWNRGISGVSCSLKVLWFAGVIIEQFNVHFTIWFIGIFQYCTSWKLEGHIVLLYNHTHHVTTNYRQDQSSWPLCLTTQRTPTRFPTWWLLIIAQLRYVYFITANDSKFPDIWPKILLQFALKWLQAVTL